MDDGEDPGPGVRTSARFGGPTAIDGDDIT
jgi:hypothetical protein